MSNAFVARFDPRSPELRVNPYPTYRHLRTHEPIHYRVERRDFLLMRYADNREVLRNPGFGRSASSLTAPVTGGNGELIDRLASTRNESRRLMGLWLALHESAGPHPDPPPVTPGLHPIPHQVGCRPNIQGRVDAAIDRARELGAWT